MKALDILKAEHDVIERVLDLLGGAVDHYETGRSLPNGFVKWALEFIRQFADHSHHRKEEKALFPLLVKRGIPVQGGPIGVMLQEHERGRECVRRMTQAIEDSFIDETAFVSAAAEYIVLLRLHILKENNTLFEIAEYCLSDDDADSLLKGFSLIEEEAGCPELQESYESELKDWEEYFESEILVPY